MAAIGTGLLSAAASAQWTNGITTVPYAGIVSGGGRLGGGAPNSIVAALGDPFGGSIPKPGPVNGTQLIAVDGTVNESASSVMVNGIAAVVTGLSFHADGVLLREGPNTVTSVATDLAGNQSSTTITVTLDTRPPARPTVAAPPSVTAAASVVLTGTKTAGTSLWINGVQVLPLNDATSWSWTAQLVEGDNLVSVLTKDAAGNASTVSVVMIVLDTLPPVITITAPAKTNLTPMALTGTVDDSLTTVTVNGITAARAGKTFQAQVPLTAGANTVAIRATSPNGYVTTSETTITLGAVPRIDAIQPGDGTFASAGGAVPIQVSATDPDGDPIAYQVSIDGAPLGAWSSQATQSWTPGLGQLGFHTITVSIRDAFGGSSMQHVDVWVVRPPIEHP